MHNARNVAESAAEGTLHLNAGALILVLIVSAAMRHYSPRSAGNSVPPGPGSAVYLRAAVSESGAHLTEAGQLRLVRVVNVLALRPLLRFEEGRSAFGIIARQRVSALRPL